MGRSAFLLPAVVAVVVAATGQPPSSAGPPTSAAAPPAAATAAPAPDGSASITSEPFGTAPDGTPLERYTLVNARGMRMRVLTWGGVVQTLEVPGRRGVMRNVVLGFPTAEEYADPADPYFGALIGRYANRIAGASFTLDGTTYPLLRNNATSPHQLHGGPTGFDDRVWEAEPVVRDGRVGLRLHLLSEDGDQGFPGNLDVTVTYVLRNRTDTVAIRYRATTDEATVVNLTQHSYFNLQGEGSGSVEDHLLRIPADAYTPVDDELIPLGGHADVAGTPFDFREAKPIGRDLRDADPQISAARGYDHNFVLDDPGPLLHLAAEVHEPDSGRTLRVLTEEPGVQFYSGNFLNGRLIGTSGRAYRQGDALALEPQHFPDSPNRPEFPSTVLRPGEVYSTTTLWRFSAR